jgi:hypothetical protein
LSSWLVSFLIGSSCSWSRRWASPVIRPATAVLPLLRREFTVPARGDADDYVSVRLVG